MKPIFTLAASVAAATLLSTSGNVLAASPADDVRAAVTATGAEVATAEPKAFLAAVSAVLAGLPAAQVPAHAGAAAGLRPDLAVEVVHAAISALHLPGRLPEAALVAATVKAAVAAAPTHKDMIVARAVVDAPEARDQVFAAAGIHTGLPAVTVASLGNQPGSQARLSDTLTTVSNNGATIPSATISAPTAPVAEGALNPANAPTARRRLPTTSGF